MHKTGVRVVRCRRCSLGAFDGGDEMANAAYDDHYVSADADPLTVGRFDELLGRLASFRTGRALLEIGVGDGSFLKRAREHGWDIVGTETARGAVWRLVAEGLDVRLGEHAAATVAAGSCDAVVMLEVLEHVADPERILLEARDALRPGGALLLSTPNADSLTRRLIGADWHVFADEHRWYFTPRSLRWALERSGFRVSSLAARNIYPPEILRALRARTRSRYGPSPSEPPLVAACNSRWRDLSRRSTVGRVARVLVNAVLTATASGDTLWLVASRVR